VDFSIPNHAGNTPLSHAVAFGRDNVVKWLLEDPSQQVSRVDDVMALSLAQDFVHWTNGNVKKRTEVLNLFFQEEDEDEFDTMDGLL
jgi:ankyrin repeat protein